MMPAITGRHRKLFSRLLQETVHNNRSGLSRRDFKVHLAGGNFPQGQDYVAIL